MRIGKRRMTNGAVLFTSFLFVLLLFSIVLLFVKIDFNFDFGEDEAGDKKPEEFFIFKYTGKYLDMIPVWRYIGSVKVGGENEKE